MFCVEIWFVDWSFFRKNWRSDHCFLCLVHLLSLSLSLLHTECISDLSSSYAWKKEVLQFRNNFLWFCSWPAGTVSFLQCRFLFACLVPVRGSLSCNIRSLSRKREKQVSKPIDGKSLKVLYPSFSIPRPKAAENGPAAPSISTIHGFDWLHFTTYSIFHHFFTAQKNTIATGFSTPVGV